MWSYFNDIYHVASQSSWINKTTGHHTEEVRKIGFKVRTYLSGVRLVVIRQRHLSRGLPVFVSKQDNRSSHRGGQKDRFKVRNHLSGVSLVVIRQRHLSRGLPIFVNKQDNRSSHRGGQKDRFQSANSPQWCKSCGHTSTTFITWPPSLRE